MTESTSAPRPRRAAAFVALFVLAALLLGNACRLLPGAGSASPAGSASAGAPSSAIERLRTAAKVARPILSFAGLACLALAEPDRGTCQLAVGALRELLGVADGVLTAADTCRTSDTPTCLQEAEARAAEQLPRLEALTDQVEQLARGGGLTDARLAGGGAGGAGGLAGAAGASGQAEGTGAGGAR